MLPDVPTTTTTTISSPLNPRTLTGDAGLRSANLVVLPLRFCGTVRIPPTGTLAQRWRCLQPVVWSRPALHWRQWCLVREGGREGCCGPWEVRTKIAEYGWINVVKMSGEKHWTLKPGHWNCTESCFTCWIFNHEQHCQYWFKHHLNGNLYLHFTWFYIESM